MMDKLINATIIVFISVLLVYGLVKFEKSLEPQTKEQTQIVIHVGNKCPMCGRGLYIEEVRQADGWIDHTPVERK